MATKLRLARHGNKQRPFYWLVATNSTSPRDGNFIEKLGTYNPLLSEDDGNRVKINKERIVHWLSVGAIPTERTEKLLEVANIDLPKKIKVQKDRKDATRKKAQAMRDAEAAKLAAQKAAEEAEANAAAAAAAAEKEAAEKKAAQEAEAAAAAAASEQEAQSTVTEEQPASASVSDANTDEAAEKPEASS